jgi:hypothetical protein
MGSAAAPRNTGLPEKQARFAWGFGKARMHREGARALAGMAQGVQSIGRAAPHASRRGTTTPSPGRNGRPGMA